MSESKQRLTESVSALVDGEVSELELHRILKQLELEGSVDPCESEDQTISGKWSRYNLISQAIAGTPLVGKDISQSVSDAIAREPKYKTHFLQDVFQAKSMGRFAIAASVATMAIIGVQQLNNTSPLQQQGFQAAGAVVDSAEPVQRPANQFPSGFQPMIEARTVNAGGVIKTSQQPSLIKLVIPNKEANNSLPGLNAKDAENKNITDDLPVDLEKDSTAK